MQLRASQATTDKEHTKLKIEALKRTLDSHLLRLNAILNGPDVNFDRLASAIQGLDVELRAKLAESGDLLEAAPSDGTYEVLRNSLNETQKRCKDLNDEMLRVADANEELHNTLRSLKATNRRLVEEVQKQTEELSTLTQQRLGDMEKLSKQEEAFSREKACWVQDAQKTLEEEQRRLDEDFAEMQEALNSRLDSCWRKAAAAKVKTEALRGSQRQLKSDVQSFAHAFSQGLKGVERELLDRIAAEEKKMRTELNRLQDLEHGLEVRVKAEREVRANEVQSWRSRHTALATDLEALITRRDQEVFELQSKVNLAISSRESQESSAKQERAALQEKAEALSKDVAMVEAMTQTARRKANQLEGRLALVQGERDRLQATVDTLRQRVHDSDEALAEAVRNNEALRQQMEVQRLDAQTANEQDLKLCREMFQQRMDSQAGHHQAEEVDLRSRIRGLEDVVGLKAGKIQVLREAVAEKTKVRESLLRDVSMWKAQHELAAKMRADVEKDFEAFKEECLGRKLREKQEEHEALLTKQAELEARRGELLEEAQKLDRESQEREAAETQRAQNVAELRREVVAEAERTKSNLAEVENALASAKAEAAAVQQQLSERKDSLEQELARLTGECDAERRELERRIQAEKVSCDSLRQETERLRQEQAASYKAAVEVPSEQLLSLEGSISEIQHSADLELSSLRQKSEKLRVRSEELEAELQRKQARLAHTEQEVQEGTRRLNTVKAKNRQSLEALQKEKSRKADELRQIQRSIASKSSRLRSGEGRRSPPRRMSPEPGRLSPLGPSARPAEDLTTSLDRSRWDSLLIEDTDLRRCLNEQRSTTRQLQELERGLHRSLANMEDRATDLRRGLR